MAGNPAAFEPSAFQNSAFQTGETTPPVIGIDPVTYGGGGLGNDAYELRVRAWWEQIDRLRAQNREREAAETERKAEIEASRQALAEIESRRSRKRTKAAQQARELERAAIQRDIAAAEAETEDLRLAISDALRDIERIQTQIAEAEQVARRQFLIRRNAMALLLIAASN
jgi:septal ring factor EnvC (AmiA/AmiB activator)